MPCRSDAGRRPRPSPKRLLPHPAAHAARPSTQAHSALHLPMSAVGSPADQIDVRVRGRTEIQIFAGSGLDDQRLATELLLNLDLANFISADLSPDALGGDLGAVEGHDSRIGYGERIAHRPHEVCF